MLSWDDFRVVKAIADHGSIAKAAVALQINQSTVFRNLSQIETKIDARLFERQRSGTTLTPRGEQMVRLAERMAEDVAAFEKDLHGGASTARFATGVVSPEQMLERSGLEFLGDIVEGKLPQPPICATLGFRLSKVENGYARFDGLPEFRHYNPIGTVHGGFAATLLDSALGCAIFTTLTKGETWTTLELKINFIRPLAEDTGEVLAEGRVIHRGRSIATSDGAVKDRAGKLYAHASTTCMIFPAKT